MADILFKDRNIIETPLVCVQIFATDSAMPDQILPSVDPLARSYTKSFSSAQDPAQLLPLVDLISKSVALLVEEYRSSNQVVPSLDSTSPSPFDAPESKTPAMSRAVQIIEAACAQLCFTVASPGHVIINVSSALLTGSPAAS